MNNQNSHQVISVFVCVALQVRLDPEIQELRAWQREWREENENIKNKVEDFWAKQMPGGDGPTPNASEEQLNWDEQVDTEIPSDATEQRQATEPQATIPVEE